MRVSLLIKPFSRSCRASCHAGLATTLLPAMLACLMLGCSKHEPSYKDRIGTIDPATVLLVVPEAPASAKKQR